MKKGDNFTGRRRELEEKFFSERDQALLRALREKVASKERKKALAEASGIDDEDLLGRLDEANVCSETLAALSLIPLIAVAWADGNVDTKERQAVLTAAEQKGVEKDHPAHQMLESWLTQSPDAKLLAVWKNYVAVLSQTLDETAKNSLQADILGRARTIAETTGGLLGLGNKVSKSEQAMLDDLEKAFA